MLYRLSYGANSAVPNRSKHPGLCERMVISMKLVELIVRPEKLEDLKAILSSREIRGMTVAMVTGCGKQKGRRETYRGTQFSINLIPKVKVETVVSDEAVDGMIREISEKLRTGKIGDGKIFVYNVEQAVRIRTGEIGTDAI